MGHVRLIQDFGRSRHTAETCPPSPRRLLHDSFLSAVRAGLCEACRLPEPRKNKSGTFKKCYLPAHHRDGCLAKTSVFFASRPVHRKMQRLYASKTLSPKFHFAFISRSSAGQTSPSVMQLLLLCFRTSRLVYAQSYSREKPGLLLDKFALDPIHHRSFCLGQRQWWPAESARSLVSPSNRRDYGRLFLGPGAVFASGIPAHVAQHALGSVSQAAAAVRAERVVGQRQS